MEAVEECSNQIVHQGLLRARKLATDMHVSKLEPGDSVRYPDVSFGAQFKLDFNAFKFAQDVFRRLRSLTC